MAAAGVPKLYRSVIDDVINNVREAFLDEGIDEQVLLELKQTWERKLLETKVIEQQGKEQETSVNNQSGSNGQTVITQNSSGNPRQLPLAGNHNRTNQYTREQLLNHNQQQNQFNVQQVTTQQSQQSQASQQQQQQQQQQPQQTQPQSQQPQQQHQQAAASQQHRLLQQSQPMQTPSSQTSIGHGPRNVAGGTSTLAQQLTLAPGSIVQPTLFQYTAGEGVDGQKTVTLLPQKVTFAFNPQTQNIQTVMSSPATTATLALPPELTASLLQQAGFNAGNVINVTQAQASVVQHTSNQSSAGTTIQYQPSASNIIGQRIQTISRPSDQNQIVQLDGPNDSSEDDDDDDEFRDNDDDHEDNDDEQNEDENEAPGEEEEPLNSEDDVSDEDPTELFDTDNVVVCQYDKITRSRNKWKFHLKDGIMNLQGKDYVFQKAIGDAEW